MDRLKRATIAAGTGAIPVLSLGCFTALAIYAGNPTEFSMSLPELLRYCSPWLLAIVVATSRGARRSGGSVASCGPLCPER